ncbi:MAG: HNH endonuclease [Bacteroidia bacterium]|nr:HNH endonuclease [Bacteroidia bacterium]
MLVRESVLVLNQDYQAIGVCSAERAFILVVLQKAEMLSHHPMKKLRSVNKDYKFPSIIRLYRYVHFPYKRVNLSRHNVFKRDNNRCVYCGSKDALTIDHVHPKSLGGRDSWDNLVTACQKCNSQKGSLTPEQAGLSLQYEPFRPSFVMFLSSFNGQVRDDWKPYLYMS